MDSGMNRVLFFMHSLYLMYWATHRPEPAVKQQNLPRAVETSAGK
jgi:hypothetical protein